MGFGLYLAGNANVGKTSLYNNLTKSFEHIGNWHGVTVEAVSKTIAFKGQSVEVTDLPGIYSLSVYTNEENVTRDTLLEIARREKSDAIVLNIAEVNNLVRNLYLTVQLMELGVRFVLVINMIDELKKNVAIDYKLIERYVGAPVLATSSRRKGDEVAILDKCASMGKSSCVVLPYLNQLPIARVKAIVKDFCGLPPDYCAIKLLEKDAHMAKTLGLSPLKVDKICNLGDYADKIATYRYRYIESIIARAVTEKRKDKSGTSLNGEGGGLNYGNALHKHTHGESVIDRIILNKYLALPVLLMFMCGIFMITFGSIGGVPLAGKFLSNVFRVMLSRLFDPVVEWLIARGSRDWVVALVRDGIVGGVGGVLVFLPQVVIMFLFLAFMEDSGYMARVAYMTDGILRKLGLSGKSSFTMLMGFGCSASAVLTSRNLEEENVRKKTVMITPFLPCGARLPVFAVIGGAFFSGGNVAVIFSLYLLGILVGVFWAWILERFTRLKSVEPDYIMEMPPYRMPTAIRVGQLLIDNVKSFLIRVGTLIFSLNIIIWILSNFTFTFEYTVDGGISMMRMIAGFVAPLFRPLGFGNWKAITALVSGLIAKESVVSVLESMGAITGEGAIFDNAASALSFMVFTLLYIPCVATISAVNKEIGRKYMLATLAIEFVTAYVIAFLVFNLSMMWGLGVG